MHMARDGAKRFGKGYAFVSSSPINPGEHIIHFCTTSRFSSLCMRGLEYRTMNCPHLPGAPFGPGRTWD